MSLSNQDDSNTFTAKNATDDTAAHGINITPSAVTSDAAAHTVTATFADQTLIPDTAVSTLPLVLLLAILPILLLMP